MNRDAQASARSAPGPSGAFRPKEGHDETTQNTHAAELEAVHLAILLRPIEETSTSLRDVLERLGSPDFEATLRRAREGLQMATF